jgi:hypothetical protein
LRRYSGCFIEARYSLALLFRRFHVGDKRVRQTLVVFVLQEELQMRRKNKTSKQIHLSPTGNCRRSLLVELLGRHNPAKPSPKQIRQLANAIRKSWFTIPVLIDRDE